MLQRLRGLSVRRAGAPALLFALTASLLVALPAQTASAVIVAQEDSVVAAPLPAYGPGRLKNATPMTQGCVVTRTRVITHLKKEARCGPGSRKVEFKVAVATPLCMMPGGALKTYRSRAACRTRDGVSVRGLGNNKMLFCAMPGQAVRWVSKRQKCVGRERAFTLRNHRPVALTLGGGTVDENAGPNALVATLNTVDVDPGDVQRYSLVSGAGSSDNALFRVAAGQLLAREGLDHEAGQVRRVRVRVRDFRHGRLTKSFTIQVNDVNESPTGLALTGDSVVENAAPGTEVGILSAADVDAADVQSYTLVGSGNDNGDFEILGDRLVTGASLDHEAGATRTIRVRVTDVGGLSEEREFSVDVTDVNELPTALTLSRDVVAENAPAQTLVGTFAVADIDAGAPYSFEVVAGVDDADLFVVSGDELRTTRPLDHEAGAIRTVRVRVTDVDGLTYTDTLSIRVVDLNEAPTALRVDGDEVDENAPAGTEVGLLTGADPDRGDVLTFSLATGADDADNYLFEIVGDRLLTTAPLDHERSATRSIRLKVADAAGLTYERVLTVSVLDVNEAPTGLRLSRDTIDENVAVGSVVGTLAADDQDTGDVLSFALTSGEADNDYFEVVGTELRTARGLDHEAAATRTVRLRVTDAAGAQQSRSFTITVRDLNEGPGDLRLDHDQVEENSVAGTLVGTLSAADEDDADTLTFSLVVGAGDVDNDLFEIVGDELLTRRPLDHEAASSRSVRVRVTDAAGEQYVRAFTLTVLDVNEGPQAPSLGDDRVRENAPSGTVVGRLHSSDPDVGDVVSFTLATGTGDGHNGDFEIVGDELRTTRAFDFETEPTRSVRIRASDGALTASTAFVVRVIDVDEAPTGLALDHDEIDENVVGAVGTLTATDAEGNALTYSLATGSGDMDNSDFEIVGDELRTTTGLDFEAGQSRSVRIQVTDGTTPVSRVFTITVLDVNEAPGALSLSARGVDENVARAVVGTVSADDPDAGSTLTYALEAGAGDIDNGEFEMVGTTLRTRAALDFEAGATRSVRIVATDGTETVAGIFTIIVRDRNDAPTEIVLDRAGILDSAMDDAVVGTLSATDQDAARPHVFSLVAGGDHGGLFTVVDDELRVAGSLVGVTGPKTVKVRVTDTWGGVAHTHEELLSVTVTSDTALTLTLGQDTVEENSAAGTRVGAFQAVGAGVAPFTYALVSDAADNSDFSISNGALVTSRALDHEMTPTRAVRVLITDADGLRWVRDVTVRVTDVNEPPRIVGEGISFLEGKPGSYSLGGRDPEGAPLTWSFATCTQGGDDNDRFTVNPTTGTFSYRGLVDFEEWAPTGIIRLCMGVSDGVHLTTIYRTPKVYDENEPTTDITLDSHSVDVAASVGTVVGTLTAVDQDSRKPLLSDISVAGTHSGAGYFTVVGSQLVVARDLSDLPLGAVQIRIDASDSWSVLFEPVAQSFRKVLTIEVQRPLTLIAPDTTVAEDEPIGTGVSTLSATGGEAPYAYALDGSGDDNTLFEMVGHELRTKETLNFESKSSLTVKVKVTDNAGVVERRAVTVTVTDVNEDPTAITVTGTLTENAPAGTTARTLAAVDPDAGESHVYTLVAGSGAGDNADFEIVGDGLVTKRSFDHEVEATRSVRIRVTDSGGKTFERAVTIAVADLPEAPTAVTLSHDTLDEGLPAGTDVGTLTVTDPDTGESHTFSVPTTVPFEVVGTTLKTTAVLDFGDRTSWTFDLVVTDKDGLTLTKSITLRVTDVVLDPLAGDDTVNGIVGNTRSAPGVSVLANDDDPERGTLRVTPGALPTTRGGTVTMAADGTFRYDPPVGVKNVTDTVDYEITSSVSGRRDTGTLSLVITNRLVWYVDAAVTATGSGTSHSPFKTVDLLGQGTGSDKDKAGEEIFLADGTYGPLTLKSGQGIYGARAGLPGLVDADPAALATVRTTDTRAALALAAGTTVDGVLMHSFGTGPTGPALLAGAVSNATVTAKSRIHGQTGQAVRIVSGSGVIAIAASVEGRTNDLVQVDNRSGAVAFTGLVESRGTNPAQRGVVMTNNTGTVSFSGGLQLHTTGSAFTASGGGTVTVTGENNWVKSTGSAAMNVSGTAIGSDGIRLKRVDVGTGTGTGIVLRDTGVGRLVVTGDGSSSLSQVGSVALTDTNGADLTAVNVSPRSDGRASVGVERLGGRVRLTDSTVTASADNGLFVNGSTGEVVLVRTAVTGSADSGVVVVSSAGTSSVTVTDSTISGSGTTGAARDGLRVESSGAAFIATTVTGSTFGDNRGDQIQVVARGNGNSSATITDNSVSSTGQGIVVNAGGSGFTGRLAYDVRANTIPRSGGVAIAATTNGAGTGTVEGYVHSNVVGGSQCTTGILVDAEGAPVLVASVKDNQLTGCIGPVLARGAQDGSQLHLTLSENEIPSGTNTLRVGFGRAGSTGFTCLAPGVSPGTVMALDILGGALGLPGYNGTLTQSGVTAWLDNRVSPGTSLVTLGSGSHLVSNLSCLTPTF